MKKHKKTIIFIIILILISCPLIAANLTFIVLYSNTKRQLNSKNSQIQTLNTQITDKDNTIQDLQSDKDSDQGDDSKTDITTKTVIFHKNYFHFENTSLEDIFTEVRNYVPFPIIYIEGLELVDNIAVSDQDGFNDTKYLQASLKSGDTTVALIEGSPTQDSEFGKCDEADQFTLNTPVGDFNGCHIHTATMEYYEIDYDSQEGYDYMFSVSSDGYSIPTITEVETIFSKATKIE